MPDRIDPDSLGFLISDVARLMRANFDRLIAEAGIGLTPGEARTLSHAARAGTVRQSVLAERMGVEAMTVCGYIDRLEARGLVRRTVDPADRRAKLVDVTEAADAVLLQLAPIGTESRKIASAAMSAQEWDSLRALLKRVRATLSDARGDAAEKGRAA